ncbi:MAG: glycosyltransferase family 4 protein [Verrucomicrobiales bacterium]
MHLALTSPPTVAILTAGRDKPYALGLADALIEQGIAFEFLGSTAVDSPHLHQHPLVTFRMFRDQTEGVGKLAKVLRVLHLYRRLITYAFTAKPKVFHILWNNQIEWFDSTVLMALYRLCGRSIVFTAHNVNKGKRDGTDSWWNRLALGIQYRLTHHIFVHTERMRDELHHDFGTSIDKISVIPFGMNSTVPDTALDQAGARAQLGLGTTDSDRVLLFFGNIAPYKGLEYLVDAFLKLAAAETDLRLVIAGRPKFGESYWDEIEARIEASPFAERVVRRIEYVPDEETEVFFKAADALVLPYTHIFQSGVLFLGYNFGLPVIATDVGALKDDIVIGETGFVCRPQDAADLADSISAFLHHPQFQRHNQNTRKQEIRAFAADKYSWTKVGQITKEVYSGISREARV